MRVQTTLPAIWRESLKASAEGIGAPGKSSDSASLGQDRREPPRDARRMRAALRVELVCQDGTKTRDPFWDGPRLLCFVAVPDEKPLHTFSGTALSPAFVTQLLGQVMAGERNTAPRRVYGENDTSEALMFDARV